MGLDDKGQVKQPKDEARLIQARYDGACLTCEGSYAIGDKVHWVRAVGCWHEDCDPPRNLATYIRDRDAPKFPRR